MALKPYLGSHFKLEALFLECSLECLWDFCVNTNTTNVIKEFNNSNLGTESRPDWTKFKTNNTTANNCQILGNFFKRKSTSGWNNGLFTNYFSLSGPTCSWKGWLERSWSWKEVSHLCRRTRKELSNFTICRTKCIPLSATMDTRTVATVRDGPDFQNWKIRGRNKSVPFRQFE